MVVLVYVALRQSLLTVMRFVKRLCSRVRMDWRNFDGFPSRIGPTHISEDWARLTLELPALATLQLLCHLGFGPVLSIKDRPIR